MVTQMADPRYTTPTYRTAATLGARLIAAGQGWCCEPICLMPTRHIPPGTPRTSWHVAHMPDGITIRPGITAHARCNTSEGAARGNRMRGRTLTPRRWAL